MSKTTIAIKYANRFIETAASQGLIVMETTTPHEALCMFRLYAAGILDSTSDLDADLLGLCEILDMAQNIIKSKFFSNGL